MARTRKQGFTLIEILIGTAISAILMTGLLVFLSWGMERIFSIRRAAETMQESSQTEQKASELEWAAAPWTVIGSGNYATSGNIYGSWIIVYSSWAAIPIAFVGATTSTGYCDTLSGSATETGTVQNLFIGEAITDSGNYSAGGYTIDRARNVILNGGAIVIGKEGVLGDALVEWGPGNQARLTHPSFLLMSGATLFIADTGNDRVLAYSGGAVTMVLPPSIINFPQSLASNGSRLLVGGISDIWIVQDGDATGHDGTSIGASLPGVTGVTGAAIRISQGTPSSLTGSYAIDGKAPDSVLVSWNTANLSFTTPFTYASGGTIAAYGIAIDTSESGHHIATISLSGDTVASNSFPYFVQGDGNIASLSGNSISHIAPSSPLLFPKFDATGTAIGADIWTVSPDTLPFITTTSSNRPIADFRWNRSGDMLTITWKEYVLYDCKNGAHELRDRMLKLRVK